MEKRTILIASLAIFAALVFAGAAQPQALIVGTDGLAGDNLQTVEPITPSQENGDTNASASVGQGDGSAAAADVQKDADGGDAVVGCIDALAANGNNGGSVSVGNCAGSGSAGSGELDNGTAGGAAATSLGCIVAELFGDSSVGARVGSCGAGGEGGHGSDDNGDNGGSGDNSDDNGGNGDEDGSGVAGAGASGGTGDENGTGPGGGEGGGEPCGTFEQASALMGSGPLPLWALGAGAIAAFGLGTFFAKRRKEVDPTG
jgi:hypothetical protein